MCQERRGQLDGTFTAIAFVHLQFTVNVSIGAVANIGHDAVKTMSSRVFTAQCDLKVLVLMIPDDFVDGRVGPITKLIAIFCQALEAALCRNRTSLSSN